MDGVTKRTSCTNGRGSAVIYLVFNPPADYVPRELDEAAGFDSLPAGGRLACAYRILFDKPVIARYVRCSCRSREGRVMLLSELQVRDNVSVDRNVPRLVALPRESGPGD